MTTPSNIKFELVDITPKSLTFTPENDEQTLTATWELTEIMEHDEDVDAST